MASLISLSTAKKHLRITTIDQDADLTLKLAQAQAIVLDYLKGRRSAIASIAVASPTVITTSVPHGLTTGATVTIADTTSTPVVTGPQVVTVTGLYTFTVPVAVTSGQAAEAGTVIHTTWTEATTPLQVQAAILQVFTHLVEHRGDDAPNDPAISVNVASLLMRSRDPALA